MSFKTLFSMLIIVVIFGAGISGCSKSCTELKLDMLDEMAEKCEDLEKNEIKDGKVLINKFKELGLTIEGIEAKVNEAQPECNGKKNELTADEKVRAAKVTKRITVSMLNLSKKVAKATLQ